MNLFHAVLMGIVEGLTEFLPISSTAHLMLTARLLGLEQSDFIKTFEIAIQPGAILAVVVLYWRKFLVHWAVLVRVFVAFIPTAFLGATAYRTIKNVFLDDAYLALISLGLGGVFLILFEMYFTSEEKHSCEIAQIPLWKCVLIGLIQSVSFVPGVSRAAATIIGGLSIGLDRKTSVEFSFLLAVPTMAAATAWDLLKSSAADSAKDTLTWTHGQLLAAGFVTSFLVAIASIKLLLWFVRRSSFVPFGFYRIMIWLIIMAWITMAAGSPITAWFTSRTAQQSQIGHKSP